MTSVSGVTLHPLSVIRDQRGELSVGEFERQIPFAPKRYFVVAHVHQGEIRGQHAHRKCRQFLVCVSGSCTLIIDDGIHRDEIILDDPGQGVYLPAMTWGIQQNYSEDAVLLVFASDYYDAGDYVRDYQQFLDLKAQKS